MPQVVNTGTGTHGIGSHVFRPGVTDCDDVAVLNHLTQDSPDHIEVHGHVLPEVEAAPSSGEGHASEPGPSSDEDEDAAGPDVSAYTADLAELHAAAAAAQDHAEHATRLAQTPEHVAEQVAAEHTAEAAGPVTKGDLEGTFACRAEGCDKELTTSNGRATHERMKHPELDLSEKE